MGRAQLGDAYRALVCRCVKGTRWHNSRGSYKALVARLLQVHAHDRSQGLGWGWAAMWLLQSAGGSCEASLRGGGR